ncbi:MAG: hypothetical protein ABFS08_12095 [Pseudomonadota bacterium]
MKEFIKIIITLILALLFVTGCNSKSSTTKQMTPEEIQQTAEEKQARDKHKLCTYLAKYTFKGDSYKEMVQLKKIRERGFDDAECQHYYDTQLNKYTSGTWVRRLKNLGSDRERVIISNERK